MSKTVKKIIAAVIALLAVGVYYYVALPAVNIHSVGFWQCLLFLIAACTAAGAFDQIRKEAKKDMSVSFRPKDLILQSRAVKAGIALFVIVGAIFLVGSLLSSPIVNAGKYQKLLTVENSDFSRDIKEVSYKTIQIGRASCRERL